MSLGALKGEELLIFVYIIKKCLNISVFLSVHVCTRAWGIVMWVCCHGVHVVVREQLDDALCHHVGPRD